MPEKTESGGNITADGAAIAAAILALANSLSDKKDEFADATPFGAYLGYRERIYSED